MRLTNTIRHAFVRAAMQDVPTIDYQEKTRVFVQACAVAQLPPAVRALYDDPELRAYVRNGQTYFDDVGYVAHVQPRGSSLHLSPEEDAQIKDWETASNAQYDRNNDLKAKLQGVANACTTRERLVEMLPEFEKYLPADNTAACRTLPVLANVVTDFMRAGWPAGAQTAA